MTDATLVVQPKHAVKSVTLWGGVVSVMAALAPIIGQAAGVELTAEDVQQGADHAWKVYQAILGLVGFSMIVYGRFKKTIQPVTLGSTNKTVIVDVPQAVVEIKGP